MKQIVLIIFTFIMAFYLNNKILNATELLAVRVAENYYPYEVEEDGEDEEGEVEDEEEESGGR